MESSTTENNIVFIEDLLPQPPLTQQVNEVQTPEQRRKVSRKMRNMHSHFYEHHRDARSSKKGNGVRNTRRCDNLNYLLSLVEAEDDSEQAGPIEIVEPRLSAFAELFKEADKMKIWNDFMNCTEEDQLAIIEKSYNPSSALLKPDLIEKQEEEASEKFVSMEKDVDDSWEIIDEKIVDDKRSDDPSYYAAEEGFQRINQKMRSFLGRGQLPLGILEQLEDEITSFFIEWPTSVYISQLHSSFDRMLLHSLCQYLNLYSKSFNDKMGKRTTQVENKEKNFCLPKESLTNFLEKSHKTKL